MLDLTSMNSILMVAPHISNVHCFLEDGKIMAYAATEKCVLLGKEFLFN